VSDKHLTENCGLLSNLQPGDQVLADPGFTVGDSVGLYCAESKYHPSQRERSNFLDSKLTELANFHACEYTLRGSLGF
jgi:hypothetical protein